MSTPSILFIDILPSNTSLHQISQNQLLLHQLDLLEQLGILSLQLDVFFLKVAYLAEVFTVCDPVFKGYMGPLGLHFDYQLVDFSQLLKGFLSLADHQIILDPLHFDFLDQHGPLSDHSILTAPQGLIHFLSNRLVPFNLQADLRSELMFFFKHIVNDSSDTFFIVAAFKEILLFFVILIPLSQQFSIVLFLHSFFFLCIVLSFYLIFVYIQVSGSLGNLELDLFALFQNNDNFLIRWQLHINLFCYQVYQQFVNFLDELVFLKLERVPLFLSFYMSDRGLFFLTLCLLVLFMPVVDFSIQKIYFFGKHYQFVLVFADRITGVHPFVDDFRQSENLVILEGGGILQVDNSILNKLVIFLNSPIFLNNKSDIIFQLSNFCNDSVHLFISIVSEGSVTKFEDGFAGRITIRGVFVGVLVHNNQLTVTLKYSKIIGNELTSWGRDFDIQLLLTLVCTI